MGVKVNFYVCCFCIQNISKIHFWKKELSKDFYSNFEALIEMFSQIQHATLPTLKKLSLGGWAVNILITHLPFINSLARRALETQNHFQLKLLNWTFEKLHKVCRIPAEISHWNEIIKSFICAHTHFRSLIDNESLQ